MQTAMRDQARQIARQTFLPVPDPVEAPRRMRVYSAPRLGQPSGITDCLAWSGAEAEA
ncbi:hypothetical protein XFF7767_850002 [Xanthomonas citri pv. fuscans]|uniref:Uncharacterized protein n=1 Tax=Xanthomonas campestris pv. phaseoli TaxID=317013 RepID=A0A7Z7IYW1_XANCH|nr:hypothetical protein XFF6990_240002 [Xanthomonas citri pv. fuscans]SOO24128.1 hypothetical protein XFF6991_320127 [Xanthomonas phaseoli pv. phaseoli]SOO00629.1 hypothetical protein XFF6960_340094 [Xanthomonas citri pv. fuscans]SOO06960.1 hypothetical protein XFF7767_850002 [Xanthomonas citri pv. fuscans]SOO12095.1 hypothetical protein XFF6970_990204 [Xanthomonas citri pv. fuscans]